MGGDKLLALNAESLKRKIYGIRGTQIMLDKDLADLYDVKPIRLREQVKRNIQRFPEDFMFQLTKEEVQFLVSQNAIPSRQHLGGHLPYVFTEQGVAMLSGILRSNTAVQVSIQIINAFVSMRKFLSKNPDFITRLDMIERKQVSYETKMELLFAAMETYKPKQGVFFNGQIFDAYELVSKLIKGAKNNIILIDNYVDESVLTLFSKSKAKILIYTKLTPQLELDLQKYNSQYPQIKIRDFTKSHDRFMIIDNKDVYHFGASLKDLGKKWFAFSKFDKESINLLDKLGLV